MFNVDIAHVDGDAHLIMRKLEFVYLTLLQGGGSGENPT